MSGNMIAITDDTGAVAAKFLYTPFGEVIDSVIGNPACDIPIGFAGAFGVLREPNGLYYMNARFYDPAIGRFLSEDPLGLGGGDLTLYSYAGNNPVVFVDPSGLCRTSGLSPLTSYRKEIAGLSAGAWGTSNEFAFKDMQGVMGKTSTAFTLLTLSADWSWDVHNNSDSRSRLAAMDVTAMKYYLSFKVGAVVGAASGPWGIITGPGAGAITSYLFDKYVAPDIKGFLEAK